MARGKGGNRENSTGKILANAAQGAAPKVNFDGGYGDDTAQAPLQANRTAPATPSVEPTYAPAPRPVMPLDAPDDQPWVPVTAGIGSQNLDNTLLMNLQALWQKFPHPELLDLIQAEKDRHG